MAIFTNQATLNFNGQSTSSNVTTGELLDTLGMTKDALTSAYNPRGRVVYMINVTNNGAAITNATITDDLGTYTLGATEVTPLDYVDGTAKLYIDGILTTPLSVSPGPPLVFNGINIPAGANVMIVYEVVANEYAPLAQGSQIMNTATLNADGTNLTDTAEVPVADSVNLTIAKALCPETVTDNGMLTYTFIIQNTGNTEVVATDNLTITDIFNPILNPITVTYNGLPWTEGTEYTYDEATGTFATLPGFIAVPAATYVNDPTTGSISTVPGVAVITVTGTV